MNEQLLIFLRELEHSNYGQKYKQWEQYLEKSSHGDDYLVKLAYFLQHYPFNYKYWIEYIQLTKPEEYFTALQRNPKSYELWISYLEHCKQIYSSDIQKYKKQLEKGIIEVGADSRSLSLYEDYYEMVNQAVRFQFFKKIFTRALIGIETMYERFQTWFATLTDTNITSIITKQIKGVAANLSPTQQREYLLLQISQIYDKTLNYREKRLELESKINHNYFDGSLQIQKEKEIWRNLINLERANGIVENISYCYERSLMAQTDDIDLWEQVFHYMENQTNKYSKVLSILRSNRQFFLKFNLNLYFYWSDMEQRENPATARRMYQEIVKTNSSFEVYERWIQLEIRQKQWNHAKEIYDNLLKMYQKDIDVLSYILVQYGEFVVRYYKDYEYPKKLFKNYFDALPFNNYLFTNYIQFMKHFENKEGYYDELMLLISEALSKAKRTLSEAQFDNVIKMVKFYLRSTLSSIYLIKISERKMIEVEEKLKQN